jgi:hypothetical protein
MRDEAVDGPHSGIVQSLMADGSVHPVKVSINPIGYMTLACGDGRETIDRGSQGN